MVSKVLRGPGTDMISAVYTLSGHSGGGTGGASSSLASQSA